MEPIATSPAHATSSNAPAGAFLIDCGLYQGSRELAEENAGDFGFDPASIDFVLLTHAHLDHCGRLPLLTKRGFRGEIITTDGDARTRQAGHARCRAPAGGGGTFESRIGRGTARATSRRRSRCIQWLMRSNAWRHSSAMPRYGEPIDLAQGVRATFVDAGHILGSASILLELTEAGRTLRLLFSGDLGNGTDPLLLPPPPPPRADVAVIETTYGDRLHKPMDASIDELYGAITDTLARGGNVIIPTFALERAQELLFVLNQGIEKNRLKPSMQVFLDLPMAISATEIFAHHLDDLRPEAARLFREGRDPLALPGLHFTRRRGGIGGAEQYPRRGDHHGRVGHGDGRTGGAPPPT